MNNSVELPSGKILNIVRFVALIPNTNTSNQGYDLILEGYSSPICTQWQMLKEEFPSRYIVIATTNVKHLSRFAQASVWREIKL